MIDLIKTKQNEIYYTVDCRMNSLSEVLYYHGLQIEPFCLLILSEVFSNLYVQVDTNINGHTNSFPLFFPGKVGIEEQLLDLLGVEYVVEYFTDSIKDEQRMKQLLANNIPIITYIDSLAGFNRPTIINTPIHHLASPVIVGFEDETDEVILFWSNNTHNRKYMKLSKQVYNKYRGNHCLPVSPDYKCLYITDVSKAKEKIATDKNELLLRAITHSVNSMFDSTNENITILEKLNYQNYWLGYSAIEHLFHDIKQITYEAIFIKKNSLEYLDYCSLVFGLLKSSLTHGSFSAYREELGCPLQFGNLIENRAILRYGKQILKSGKLWRKVSICCSKIRSRMRNSKRYAVLICILLKIIICKEKWAFKGLKKELNKEFLCIK